MNSNEPEKIETIMINGVTVRIGKPKKYTLALDKRIPEKNRIHTFSVRCNYGDILKAIDYLSTFNEKFKVLDAIYDLDEKVLELITDVQLKCEVSPNLEDANKKK